MLLDIEALLREAEHYQEVLQWLWLVWEQFRTNASVKMECHRVVCNALIGRFDCVLELIGSYSGAKKKKKISKKKQTTGKYKMVNSLSSYIP